MALPPSGQFMKCIDEVFAENSLLHSQVEQLSLVLREKDAEFDRRMGAIEYELEQARDSTVKSGKETSNELSVVHRENEDLQKQVLELQQSISELNGVMHAKSNEIKRMNAYLANLPSADEHADTLKQLRQCRDRLSETESRLAETCGELEKREAEVADTKVQLKRKSDCERLLQSQLDAAIQRLHAKSPTKFESSGRKVTPEFIEDVQFELNRYRSAYEQSKKLCEAESHRAQAAEARLKVEHRQFQERIAREEAAILGLKTSLSLRRAELDDIKKRLSQVNCEKQDLLVNLLDTRTVLTSLLNAWRSAGGKQQRRLLHQVNSAVGELDQLVNHLNSLAKGERINLSDLLTVKICGRGQLVGNEDEEGSQLIELSPANFDLIKSNGDSNDNDRHQDQESIVDQLDKRVGIPHTTPDLSTLNQVIAQLSLLPLVAPDWADTQLGSIRKSRQIINTLRQKLADSYADHLGGRLNCFVQ